MRKNNNNNNNCKKKKTEKHLKKTYIAPRELKYQEGTFLKFIIFHHKTLAEEVVI